MAAVVIRNLAEATHRALKERAKAHGRSTEAEIREILDAAVKPVEERRVKLGTEMHKLWMELGGGDLQVPPRTEMPRFIDLSSPDFGEPENDDP